MERTSYTPIDQYLSTPRVSSMGQLPAHRQIIYGRTFGARWNRNDFAGIEHHPGHGARWSAVIATIIATACLLMLAFTLVRAYL